MQPVLTARIAIASQLVLARLHCAICRCHNMLAIYAGMQMGHVACSMGIETRHAWGMTETSPIGTSGCLKVLHPSLNLSAHCCIRTQTGHIRQSCMLFLSRTWQIALGGQSPVLPTIARKKVHMVKHTQPTQ